MEQELYFGYPDDKEIELEKLMHIDDLMKRHRRIAIISMAASSVLLIISSALSTAWLDLIALIGYIIGIFNLYIMKMTYGHRLFIYAYKDYMTLEYYSVSRNFRTAVTVKYADISQCVFQNQYSEIMLVCKNSDSAEVKIYNRKSECVSDTKEKMICFKLNANTPEQGFFLYTASDLFEMKFDKRKMLGKFGDEEYYYKKIYGKNR